MNVPEVSFLARFFSESGPRDFSIESYRNTIVYLINNYLTDLDEVAKVLSTQGTSSLCHQFLPVFINFLGENSDVFQQISQDSDQINFEVSTEEKISQAFSFWLFRHVLCVLSRHDCSQIHSIVIKLIQEILLSTRVKSSPIFRQHIKEFIGISAELIKLSSYLYSGVERVSLNCFDFDIDLAKQSLKDSAENSEGESTCKNNMKKVEIVLSDTANCELLQVNIINILCGILHTVCLFVGESHMHLLWSCLCCHVEEGDFDLKMISLSTLTKLMELQGFPPVPVREYFLSCLVGLWELLCSQESALSDREKEELEQTEAKLTYMLIEQDKNGCLASDADFLQRLSTTLCSKGIASISCLEGRQALVSLFVHLLKDVSRSDPHFSVIKPYLSTLTSHAMSIVGTEKCSEYIVPLLVQLILLDVHHVDQPVNVTTGSSSEDGTTPSRKSGGFLSRKRKAQADSLPVRMVSFKVFNNLFGKMSELTVDQGPPSGVELECLLVTMRVASQCLLHLCGTDQTTSTQYSLLTWSVMSTAVECWTRYLRTITDPDSEGFKEGYIMILNSIVAVLLVNDFVTLPATVLQELSWIVTLAWIPNDFSWKDMKPSKPKEVATIASKLEAKIDIDCLCLCVKTMALLPRDACTAWKSHVIIQALGDSREKITRTVVQTFPLLLLNLGPKSGFLVEELLMLLDKGTDGVCLDIAETFGGVMLAIADVAKLDRASLDKFFHNATDLRVVASSEYDKHQQKEKGQSLNPNWINLFLRLLKHADATVRRSALHSLITVFSLIDLNCTQAKDFVISVLDLMEDPDKNVRMACCSLIPYLVSEKAGKAKISATDHLIWERLETLYCQNHGRSTRETIVLSIGQFGRVVEGTLLESVIVCLLQTCLTQQEVEELLAFEELQNIANSKGLSLHQLCAQFRPAIVKFLVEILYADQVSNDGANARSYLQALASTLGSEDLKSFLQGNERYLLPYLVSKASPETTKLLCLIASLQTVGSVSDGQSKNGVQNFDIQSLLKSKTNIKIRQNLLMNNIRYIFSHLVRFCQREDMEKALLYLQNETEYSLGVLLRLDFQRVHNELLLYLSTHYQQVFTGLKIVAEHDETYKGPKDIDSEEKMAQYLESRLLGVLTYFDSQLMTSNITLSDKELALKSVVSIIRMMGSKHICSVRHKIMNTLRLGLQFTEPTFAEISCKAWSCFIQSLELPLLGAMMSEIITTLLPLLQVLPAQVAQIFNYMIVENRAELSKHFQEIYFLPDIPELADANIVLKQFGESVTSNSDLKTLLAHSIKGISHESQGVRVHALSKLRKILKDRRGELTNYVLNSETAEPVVSELVTALLNGCRETDPCTQILYGQCLGELGAIDAGRLELITKSPDPKLLTFHPNIDHENFAFGLINVTVKAFLSATEPCVQDSAAVALQNLLRIYKISDPGHSQGVKPQNNLWNSFPVLTQEILVPLLTSRYTLTLKETTYPKPVYGSEKGKTFTDWMSNWSRFLITKVKPGMAFQVFTACCAINRFNQQVALYILPHVVLHVLLDGTPDDATEVFNEIMEVLQQLQKQDMRHENPSSFHHLSAQTVFSILDYLTMWKSHQMRSMPSTASGQAPGYERDPRYQVVNAFLKRIPEDAIAQACFNCKAYTRALRHFERFVSSGENIQHHLDFIQRIYVSMDEPDGVLGAAALRVSQPTLMQQILSHESLGQQQEAQACYERAIQMEPDKIVHHLGLLRNLMDLAQPNKALVHTAGILAERRQWSAQLNSYHIEAAWQLGSWDNLEKALRVEQQSNCNWPVLVGRILLASKEKREADFIEQLEFARREQMGPLSAASMEIGSYQRGYENILRLHMISEIEEFFHVLDDFPECKDNTSDVIMMPSATDLFSYWQDRLQMAQSSFRTQEPILTLRRTLMSMVQSELQSGLDTQVGKWWLWSAKVARKSGYMQSAYGCLLQASSYNLPDFYIEKAKWLYAKGEADVAISCLEKGISEHFGDMSLPGKKEQLNSTLKQVYARSLLLYGKYSEEASSMEANAIFKQYKDVIDICPHWEDGYFHLAKYYDKIMFAMIDEKDRNDKQGEFIIQIVKHFGQSLKFGNHHIYQSLPRLLSLWLDYGTSVMDAEKRERGKQPQKNQRITLGRINKEIEQLKEQLAPYQMFTAFPQLISRICHGQQDVFLLLEDIISSLLVTYPQQAMWMMMSVSKSSYQMRVTRCTDIFSKAIQKNGSLAKFIQDCKKLTDRLLELCEKDFGNMAVVSLSQSFKPLKRLLEDSNFSQILLPLQSLVTVNLPSSVTAGKHHNPFPDALIYIKGFDDVIEVLPSLQKPKKITMIGSDGKRYVMMCKPKDDLRKDCRLMEFNAIVNRFLHRDPECRKRRLLIRTYTVTPLNEECGLIEWVNNTTGLRYILVNLYKERGLYMTGRELKDLMPALGANIDTKMKVFKEKLLPRHPPLFPEWFNRTFPDPTSWYNARVSYARTAAVMSVIGYILGLGDRHGENILFDSNTGECVHVDFNCLFNKGETFEWPERVPFRLTHNMLAALGPLGCEGFFRRACEMTLKVIRDQMEPIMSVLRPFIYDPLVEWSKQNKGQRSKDTDSGEMNNELALTHVQNIEDRMRGILKTKSKPRSLPLSIEGHIKYLINEATSDTNLCQMYIGWAAYM